MITFSFFKEKLWILGENEEERTLTL